jgi:hypothetical protein
VERHKADWTEVVRAFGRQTPGSSQDAQPARSPAVHKREMNELIFASVEGSARTEEIAFFCECSSAACFEIVLLDPTAYAARRHRRTWAPLAPGH